MSENHFFLGLKVHAPWPLKWPEGRLIEEKYRHFTLVFFKEGPFPQKEDIPQPPFSLGGCGLFTKVLFLPEKDPHTASWAIIWQEESFEKYLVQICHKLGYPKPTKPHVTVCRSPKSPSEWKEAFCPLPFYAESLHLYESLGLSKYHSIWEYPFLAPFDEIEHTADIAFRVRGENLQNLYVHAFTALSFHSPEVIPFWEPASISSVEDIVMALNRIVTRTDTMRGCSLKAISFHGEVKSREKFLEWDMIVDI